MSDYNKLLEIIKTAATEAINASSPAGVIFGTVISVEPLRISVEQKLELTSEFLILTKNVVDYNVSITIEGSTETTSLNANHGHSASSDINVSSTIAPNTENQTITNTMSGSVEIDPINIGLSHKHDISGKKSCTIHNALKVNDKVILIQVQGGQKYIVLDKVY